VFKSKQNAPLNALISRLLADARERGRTLAALPGRQRPARQGATFRKADPELTVHWSVPAAALLREIVCEVKLKGPPTGPLHGHPVAGVRIRGSDTTKKMGTACATPAVRLLKAKDRVPAGAKFVAPGLVVTVRGWRPSRPGSTPLVAENWTQAGAVPSDQSMDAAPSLVKTNVPSLPPPCCCWSGPETEPAGRQNDQAVGGRQGVDQRLARGRPPAGAKIEPRLGEVFVGADIGLLDPIVMSWKHDR
jgi:hypothetical protein